jgi:hypothetical protein
MIDNKMIKIYYVIVTAMVLSLCIVQNTYAQTTNTETNTTTSYSNCFTGTMATFFLQLMSSPPEIKFDMSDLTSPEVKQYISNACNFYYEKSGVWLSGMDNELDKKIVSKYGDEFMQKVKTPESIKERDEGYIQLNNKTE